MAVGKGKRKRSTRVLHEAEEQIAGTSAASGPDVLEAPTAKRSRKRAETRVCPICNEPIPLRLLGKHSELEASRVDEIIGQIGSTEPFLDLSHEFYASTSATAVSSSALASSSTSTGRRSAVRARRSILEKTAPVRAQTTAVTTVIQSIKRNRKNRHAKLRDMTRDDDEGHLVSRRITSSQGEIICPVCLNSVRGDEDVQDAHIEACVANESRQLEEEQERRRQEDAEEVNVDDFGDEDNAAGHFGDVRGTGFLTRNRHEQDVDDEIDIDGDDGFGTAQFHEGDVLDLDARPVSTTSARTQPTAGHSLPSGDVDGPCPEQENEDQPANVLRDLIAQSRTRQEPVPREVVTLIPDMDKIDVAILMAKRKGDRDALLAALENKIQLLESPVVVSQSSSPVTNASLCRICLEPYNEPTVSTGCWHTCCRECWLRCLGSTKLCPICKRITAAVDLRRVYL